MRCESVRRQLAVYEALMPEERRRVDEHLRQCEGCRVLLATYRAQDRALSSLPMMTPSAEMIAAVHRRTTRRPTRRPVQRRVARVVTLAVLAFLLVLGGTLPTVAAGTLPGDALYPVKRAVEQVRLTLTIDGEERERLTEVFRAKRIEEVQALAQTEREADVAFEGELEAVEDGVWIVSGVAVVPQPQVVAEGFPQIGQVVVVEARVSEGQVSASRVTHTVSVETQPTTATAAPPTPTRARAVSPSDTPEPTVEPTPEPTDTVLPPTPKVDVTAEVYPDPRAATAPFKPTATPGDEPKPTQTPTLSLESEEGVETRKTAEVEATAWGTPRETARATRWHKPTRTPTRSSGEATGDPRREATARARLTVIAIRTRESIATAPPPTELPTRRPTARPPTATAVVRPSPLPTRTRVPRATPTRRPTKSPPTATPNTNSAAATPTSAVGSTEPTAAPTAETTPPPPSDISISAPTVTVNAVSAR